MTAKLKQLRKRQRRQPLREARGSVKPHGQPHGVFTISIDDGYVEYSYAMDIGAHHSISMVEKKIRRALRCKKVNGQIQRMPVLLNNEVKHER